MEIRRIVLMSMAVAGMGLAGCSETGESYSIERKTVDGLPRVTATETSAAEAKVEAIDYADRSIALTGPGGKTHIFKVTSAVRNFAQIKKGDTVKVEYYTQLKASVRKVSEQPITELSEGVILADLGTKPGIVATRRAMIEANVDSINYETRVLKLRTTTGDVMTITADKKLKDLEKVAAGDQVVFDYVEAVSITVN